MSSPNSIVNCSHCSFSQELAPIPITLRYEIGHGEHADMWARRGWCRNCACITDIESLPSLRELVEEVEGSDDIDGEVERALARIVWRARRRGPATCLQCALTEVEPILFEDIDKWKDPEANCPLRVVKGFRHDCGGMLLMRDKDDGVRTEYCPRRFSMSLEGEVLGQETVWDDSF
jgi:hypothetical protein